LFDNLKHQEEPMNHAFSPDLQQAIQLFFSDKIFRTTGPRFYRIGMAEIKKEFRKKALRFHPDRAVLSGESRGRLEEKFKQINDAYGILKTAFADKHLILRSRAEQRPTPPEKPGPFTRAGGDKAEFRARQATAPPRSGGPGAFSSSCPEFRPIWRKSFFFRGKVPSRYLRLGEFLFYSRIIPWHNLINAIVWQHRMRPRLGQIAVELDFLGEADILTILHAKHFKEPFGQAAVRLGFLTDYRRFVLLGRQRGYPFPLGRYFLDFNILNEATLDRHLRENRLHNFYYPSHFRSL
jgi:hypothetical protein